MGGISADVRFALRLLARQPRFAAAATLVLALGIGATAAVFSLVNALVLRPIPGVRSPASVVSLYGKDIEQAGSYRGFSYPNYLDIRDGARALDGVAAFTFGFGGITEGGLTRRGLVMMVSANYFDLLGARPPWGRAFTADEEQPSRPSQVVVVSHSYWQRHGADPALLGGTVSITGRPFTVVGIAPRGFRGTSAAMAPEFWLPLGATRLVENDFIRDIAGGDPSSRDTHRFLLVGRLKASTSLDAANRDLAATASRLADAYPAANRGYTIVAGALQRLRLAPDPDENGQLVSLSGRLLGMSTVVLLVACLNLANMLLARGAARRREIAIRLSLGASRVAVVRQLLVEGFLLSLAGGAVGMVAGRWGTSLLVRSVTPLLPIPLEAEIRLDWRVAAATVAFAALATAAFALGPALKTTRPSVIGQLKEQAGQDRERGVWLFGARNLLLAGQIAFSLALLVAGALFVRGALKAAAAGPGFPLERGLVIEIDPTLASRSLDESAASHRRAVARLRELPGVEAASMASLVPFGSVGDRVSIERAVAAPDGGATAPRRAVAEYSSVGADYFRSIGLRPIRGREFTLEEAEGSEPTRVAIIDEPAAGRLFAAPGENPVGQVVRVDASVDGRAAEPFEIVGVVPGVRPGLSAAGPTPHLYVPFSARPRAWMTHHVRLATNASPEAPIGAIRRQLTALDAGLPVISARTLESHVRGNLFLWFFRAGARLFTAFGLAALVLALVGIYGVNAYTAARRTREIGIRMALGATPTGVMRLVVRETVVVTVAGVVAGTLLAAAMGRVIGSMLFEVTAFDPMSFASVGTLLACAALAAAYIPARRAARVSVVTALRQD